MAEVCGRNVCVRPKPQEIPVNLYKNTSLNMSHVSHQMANFTFMVTSAQFRGWTHEVSHKILKTILIREKKLVTRWILQKHLYTIYQKESTARAYSSKHLGAVQSVRHTHSSKHLGAVQSVRKWELGRLGCIEHKYKVGVFRLATVALYLGLFFHMFNKITSWIKVFNL